MKPVKCSMIAAVFCVAGCAVGPEPIAPLLNAPDRFLTEPQHAGSLEPGHSWWTGLDDAVLDQIISDVLAENLSIEFAAQNLRRARALSTAARSDLFPSFDAFLDVGLNGQIDPENSLESDVAGGAAMSFTPDLFGGTRRSLQAARADLAASAFDLADAQRLVVRDALLQYIEIRRSGARLALLESSLDLQARTLEIVEARYDAGLSPALDVDRAAADLAGTRAQRGILLAQRLEAEYALSVLSGRAPMRGQFGEPKDDAIPVFQNLAPIGLPADLIRNRPDVRAAENRLVSEIALIGVEIADLYPSLQIPGLLQAGSNSAESQAETVSFSLSALIDIPLFDAGRRRAEVEAQRADADAALAIYKATLLDALREVETALTRIETLSERLVYLESAVASSESAYNQLDALYREGLATFIDVLDSQRTLISSREAVVDARAELTNAMALLQGALGGAVSG